MYIYTLLTNVGTTCCTRLCWTVCPSDDIIIITTEYNTRTCIDNIHVLLCCPLLGGAYNMILCSDDSRRRCVSGREANKTDMCVCVCEIRYKNDVLFFFFFFKFFLPPV